MTGSSLLTFPPEGFTFFPPTSVPSAVSLQGPNAKRLYKDLMTSYNPMVRPVANDSESISVKFGVTLRQIIDVVREPSTPFYWVTVCCTSQRVWGILHTKSHTQLFFSFGLNIPIMVECRCSRATLSGAPCGNLGDSKTVLILQRKSSQRSWKHSLKILVRLETMPLRSCCK